MSTPHTHSLDRPAHADGDGCLYFVGQAQRLDEHGPTGAAHPLTLRLDPGGLLTFRQATGQDAPGRPATQEEIAAYWRERGLAYDVATGHVVRPEA